jgi:acetoin utilization deacetylase AcuC-like enzyme
MDDRLAVFFDAQVFDHDTGHGLFEGPPSPYLAVPERHPENAERVRNMESVLRKGPIAEALDWHSAQPASDEALRLFHDSAYLDQLAAIAPEDSYHATRSTVMGPGSWPIIKVATGLAIAAAEYVWQGKGACAYAMTRPPGHHAQPAMADGYCFINHIGVAIEALKENGLQRAAVIDWDVHHGNGTQEGFYEDPNVLTVSMHMDHGPWGPSHKQTGHSDEVGMGPGKGLNLNVPLPFGSGNRAYLAAFDEIVAPELRKFEPEILFIAAGQDANQFDPNGRQLVNMEGFYQLGFRARELAAELCDGKLVLIQEGGYALSYAAYCLHATLEGALGRSQALDDPIAYMPDSAGDLESTIRRLQEARKEALKG